MKKTRMIIAVSLVMAYIFSFSVFADGVYFDYFDVNKNQKALNINSAISKINSINDVSYNTRFVVYNAKDAYYKLSENERQYVINRDRLSGAVKKLDSIGDLNLNGTRNAEDIAYLVNCILGKNSFDDKSDINEDKAVNILDLVAIKQLIAGR